MKSAFLNAPLSKLVYVEQPPSFEDPRFSNHVYKLHKALYGLKKIPRAWYKCLKDFLLKNNFVMGKANSTLFTDKDDKDIFVCQYMSMTLYLVLLIKNFVRSLVGS
jgi:hypothetical protein